MKRPLLALCLSLFLVATAQGGMVMDVPVTGIVASHIEGAAIYILCENGQVFSSNGGPWGQSPNHPSGVPIPVSEILDWTPRLFLARDGTAWVLQWDGTNQTHFWASSPPPPCGAVPTNDSNLGSIKSMFR